MTQLYTQAWIHELNRALTHPGARLVPIATSERREEARGARAAHFTLVADSEDEREELEES